MTARKYEVQVVIVFIAHTQVKFKVYNTQNTAKQMLIIQMNRSCWMPSRLDLGVPFLNVCVLYYVHEKVSVSAPLCV